MSYRICLMPGDGVGPEVTAAAVEVLKVAAEVFAIDLSFQSVLIGGAALDAGESPLPAKTLAAAQAADAVLLGAVGGPRWDGERRERRPESGLLALRKALGLYANLRPVRDYDFLRHRVALRPEVVAGVDMVFVRELTGGIYFGEKGRDGDFAWDRMEYDRHSIEQIVRAAFEIAATRPRQQLTSVDKANVLETSRLWREVVEEIAHDFPEVTVNHLYVDNAAYQVIVNPRQFDVLVTENSFGDILSDEGAALTGSLGMLPSASLGGAVSLFEPAHGSAPELAGENVANPIAAILSAALLLRYSCAHEEAAKAIEEAVRTVLKRDEKSADIAGPKSTILGTEEMASAIAKVMREESKT